MKRHLALLAALFLGGQVQAGEITLQPKAQEASFALSTQAITGQYVATANDTIRNYQFMLKPVSQAVTSRAEWAIVGTDAQDGWITLQDWNALATTPDASGFKMARVGSAYQTSTGSLEHLLLSATAANEWQVKVTPVSGNFELVSVPETSSLIMGFIASLVVAVVCFARNDSRFYQFASGDENKVIYKAKREIQK